MIMINELNKILIPVYTNKKVRLINSVDPVHKQTIKQFFDEQNINEKQFFDFFKKHPDHILNEFSKLASNIISNNVNNIIVTVSELDLLRIYVPVNSIDEKIDNVPEYEYDEYDDKKKCIELQEKDTKQIINIFKLYNKVDLLYFYN